MKVAPNNNNNGSVQKDIPILPLEPVVRKYAKGETLYFKLRTVPAQADSPTYELNIPYLKGTETLREALEFRVAIAKVWTGMNANTGGERNQLVLRVLKDTALTSYNTGRDLAHRATWDVAREAARANAEGAGGDAAAQLAAWNGEPEPDLTTLDISMAIEHLISFMAPYKTLQRVKRYLRRQCRKPADMNVRTFYNHFTRINNDELPLLPPFQAGQSLSEDEVIDILLFAFPKSWQGEMERQGFDPFANTITSLLDFCERMEVAESIDQPVARKSNNQGNKPAAKKGKPSGKGGGGGKYHCLHHGDNSTHDTADCIVIKKMVGSVSKDGNANKGKSKNKSWSRKAEDNKKQTEKDLAAFVRKAMKKELNALSKKRKKSDDEDDDDEESVNAFDQLDLSKMDFGSDDEQNDDRSEGEIST